MPWQKEEMMLLVGEEKAMQQLEHKCDGNGETPHLNDHCSRGR